MKTIIACFRFYDFSMDRLLELARGLSDDQLDRPFAIGPGSVREFFVHLWETELWWMGILHGREEEYPASPPKTLAELSAVLMQQRKDRPGILTKFADELSKPVVFKGRSGADRQVRRIDILLHLVNHAAHHRAQALNMLKRLGLEVPWLDYLAMRKADRCAPPDAMDFFAIREFLNHTRRSSTAVLQIAAGLSDAQLDQTFEIGLGTLRATLIHLRFAEQWWLNNWTLGPSEPFPELPADISIADLTNKLGQSVRDRDAHLADLADADLDRPILVRPNPTREVAYSLGESLLHLAHHSSHHLAQASNMLRQLNQPSPRLDYIALLPT